MAVSHPSFVLFLLLSLLSNVSFAVRNAANSTMVVVTPPPPPPPRPSFSPLKPSIAVLVGLLTTVFSVTFLLLLYVKHCKHRNGAVYVQHNHRRFDGRKNSGIERTVIESLPVFRFGALTGDKEGLECAVCLARFEPTEVLRLLPKCQHAFHVECVDTWLDAHSTCPLCRYRVDPEDILLIGDCNPWFEIRLSHREEDDHISMNSTDTGSERPQPGRLDTAFWVRRISGRHSSAGEQASRVNESGNHRTSSSRRSLDSSLRNNNGVNAVKVGCFDRTQRKDGQLLHDGAIADRKSFERRFEHRVVISAAGGTHQQQRDQRWSDVARPSDLLFLRSEMIQSESRLPEGGGGVGGRAVNKGRSASEITSEERLWRKESDNDSHRHRRQRQASAVVSRWLAWAVRPHPHTVSIFP
ncbi:PREDICTED: RING-H2 finger protein ATL43-like isoform X2 [Tarenaya hassleriana]|uniref:RING-H2 finger protein ATL43-like isoform X1 n=1 Tax=Tarenaya hassleriana TaxID=28532 RepID=UPI00053C8D23|nr:PREDICTED: RING-H2 finger protein ATL43-like isoform X1 [Tarenaya hassleriana]XP_010558087.1 PREDICTED: RING-H2 finger protein ATL43-like isoform X2 [Tarenaya hassleriana]